MIAHLLGRSALGRRLQGSPLAAGLATFLLAALMTGSLVAVVAVAIERRERAGFEYEANRLVASIEQRLHTVDTLLRGVGGLFAASQLVTRDEFRGYVRHLDLQRRFKGIQGIGFSRRLAPAEVPALEAAMRAQGLPAFRVWPTQPRSEYNAIVFLEPMDRRNAAALGYDMSTEPVRRQAMQAAARSGRIAASGGVTLVQEIEPDKQAGFLLYLPLLRPGPEGRRHLEGFVYSPLRIGDLLAGVRGQSPNPVDYEIFDGAPSAGRLLRSTLAGDVAGSERSVERRIDVGERHWTVRVHARPEPPGPSRRRLVVLLAAAALLASATLGALSWGQGRARIAAQAAAAERRATAAHLLENDRRKDEFLAMLAHELRNPLAPISTAASVLALPSLGQAHMAEVSRIIQRQVRHMSQLVDDLLDVSRVTRGTISLDRKVLDLREVVAAAIEQVQGLLDERSHEVELQLADQPVWVEGDRTRLVQVASNLLNNAAKYTDPRGRIVVEVGGHRDRAWLVVTDSGIGMAPELLPRVFELFAQAERSLDRSQGGLGIGLALVRSIVQLHGGNVRAQSEGPGQGSRFSVDLPIAPAPRAEGAAAGGPIAPPAGPREVVLVDDNVDAANTLALYLQSLGHRVREFHSAEDALAGLAGAAADVFVLDLGLPGMDGFELARRLREDPRYANACFASLSGYGQRGVDRTGEPAFDRHFLKPADMAELAAWIAGPR